jgi:shikimate kinase
MALKPKVTWALFLLGLNDGLAIFRLGFARVGPMRFITPSSFAMIKGRIFLVGFMGAGKSTVGPLLAAKLSWSFIDLDKEIEKFRGEPIREIFEKRGEPFFRRVETEALSKLSECPHCVVALGGGAFTQITNRSLIRKLGVSVFLNCPLDVILSRCALDGERPLFQNQTAIGELYQSRLSDYRESDFQVDVTNLSPERIAEQIHYWVSGQKEDVI